jgi:hypothetical protein
VGKPRSAGKDDFAGSADTGCVRSDADASLTEGIKNDAASTVAHTPRRGMRRSASSLSTARAANPRSSETAIA